MKNLRYDRKKIMAFLLALGFSFIPSKAKVKLFHIIKKLLLQMGKKLLYILLLVILLMIMHIYPIITK